MEKACSVTVAYRKQAGRQAWQVNVMMGAMVFVG
jgi:hypothetical protein